MVDKNRIEDILKLIIREGDLKEFEIDGLKCSIKRVASLKTLCGYVHLNKDFIEYGKSYDEIGVSCHGGLTYADMEDEYWTIGFDCGHFGDIIPGFAIDMGMQFTDNETYKDMEYAETEIRNLVNQLDRTKFDTRRMRENKTKDLL